MAKMVLAALVVAFAVLGPAQAAMQEQTVNRDEPRIVGMTKAEIDAEVRKAMPLPVLRILCWNELGLRKWMVEMSTTPLVAPKEKAVHLVFQTKDENGRSELLEAFAYAGRYSQKLIADVTEK